MTGIDYNGQIWDTTSQFNRYLPMRIVSVNTLIISGEATVNGSKFSKPGVIKTFQSPNPQLNIRIYRIFYKNWYIHTFECIGYFLHCKRICRSTCTDPKNVNPEFQSFIDMLNIGNFNGSVHAKLVFYLF